jgi:hypothetical protein
MFIYFDREVVARVIPVVDRAELDPESDTALIAAGYGTLTRLYGVTAPDEYRQLERPRGELALVTRTAAEPEPS